MAYKTEWEDRGVRQRYIGTVSDTDFEQATTQIFGDTRFDGMDYAIHCFLDTDEFDVNTHRIKRIAHLAKAAAITNPSLKLAIVHPAMDRVKEAIVHAAFAEHSAWQTRLFPAIDEARSWLAR